MYLSTDEVIMFKSTDHTTAWGEIKFYFYHEAELDEGLAYFMDWDSYFRDMR